jgi:transposase InsO family protein
MSKEEKKQQIALFRYSLIASAVANTFEAPSIAQHFRNVAAKKHLSPDGRLVDVNVASLERWFYTYKKLGLAGITPKSRMDIGMSRVLSDAATNRMYELREQFPYITGKAIYRKLIEEGIVNTADISLATVHRYIRKNGLKTSASNSQEVKVFEMEFANDCWQSDYSTGPKIKISGKITQTFLMALLDDASRHVLHAQFYLNENAINMQDSFRKAIAKAGVPKMFFTDNGKEFDNLQLQLICASLGIAMTKTRPYVPKGRGKVERLFRTVKDGWMNATDWNEFSSLDDVHVSFSKYLSKEYTNYHHSSIGCTPKERFMRDYERLRHISTEELNLHFLHRKECRVTNAATIKLLGIEYETPQQFIGSKIKVRYLPTDKSELFIFSDNGKLLHTIYPVKKVENSKIKRASIDYTRAGGGGS